MAMDNLHLRKLLQVMFLPPAKQTSIIRADIRSEIAKDSGTSGEGGDFHSPFWSDVKEHVYGNIDIRDSANLRISSNPNRKRLYPLLVRGFLNWWDVERRWTNEPFRPCPSPRGYFKLSSLDLTVKIENFLAVRDGRGGLHFVYPYFSEEPPLNERAGRIGLWLITQAFQRQSPDSFAILDVMRGKTFTVDKYPLTGDEPEMLSLRYEKILAEWNLLKSEYR